MSKELPWRELIDDVADLVSSMHDEDHEVVTLTVQSSDEREPYISFRLHSTDEFSVTVVGELTEPTDAQVDRFGDLLTSDWRHFDEADGPPRRGLNSGTLDDAASYAKEAIDVLREVFGVREPSQVVVETD